MRFRELLKHLTAYIDRDLKGVRCRDLEAHLKDCPPCIALINTLRKTRGILKLQPKASPSSRLRAELRRCLERQDGRD